MAKPELDTISVNHKQLKMLVKKAYQTKVPLFIMGGTGIGKSFVVREEATKQAVKEKCNFVEWNKVGDIQKQAYHDEKAVREKVHIYADLRASQLDLGDLRMPKLNSKDYVQWIPNMLFRVLSLDGVSATLFLDEFNLACPAVQASLYQVILDKCVGEIALNENVTIIAAGNRIEDLANVFDIPAPLKNRFTHATLAVPDIVGWTDWAIENKVDDRIIAFLQFKPNLLFKFDRNSKSNSFPTPRMWGDYLNKLVNGENDIDTIETLSISAIGEGAGREFTSFVKLRKKIDLYKLLENPEEVNNMEIDMKYGVITGITELYRGNSKILDKALNFSMHIKPEDLAVFTMRLLKRQNPAQFMKNVIGCKNWRVAEERFRKFIF